LYTLNSSKLLLDIVPTSSFWEPGCQFDSALGGLYAFALTNKWKGGIGGNKLTGVTSIFISKQKKTSTYTNKMAIDKQYGVIIRYEVPNRDVGKFQQSWELGASIRLFIHAKVILTM
jgi:hypothetical protein